MLQVILEPTSCTRINQLTECVNDLKKASEQQVVQLQLQLAREKLKLTAEVSHLAELEGRQMAYLAKVEGRMEQRFDSLLAQIQSLIGQKEKSPPHVQSIHQNPEIMHWEGRNTNNREIMYIGEGNQSKQKEVEFRHTDNQDGRRFHQFEGPWRQSQEPRYPEHQASHGWGYQPMNIGENISHMENHGVGFNQENRGPVYQ